MQFSIGAGTERRAYTAQEIGILQDIGWNAQAVPEPGSLALLSLVVVGAVGYRWRRLGKKDPFAENAA